MKIGFDANEETEKEEPKPGYADSESEEENFHDWILHILLDFSIGYGFFSFLRDVLNQFRRRSY